MLNEQVIKGNWTELRGRVKEKWGDLTDDDLVMAEGRADKLVGIIQKRTGEAKEKIEHELDQMTNDYESASDMVRRKASATADKVSYKAHELADQVSHGARAQYDMAHERLDEVSHRVREQYGHAEDCVRKNPVESVAVAFGSGLTLGIVLGLLIRPGRN